MLGGFAREPRREIERVCLRRITLVFRTEINNIDGTAQNTSDLRYAGQLRRPKLVAALLDLYEHEAAVILVEKEIRLATPEVSAGISRPDVSESPEGIGRDNLLRLAAPLKTAFRLRILTAECIKKKSQPPAAFVVPTKCKYFAEVVARLVKNGRGDG